MHYLKSLGLQRAAGNASFARRSFCTRRTLLQRRQPQPTHAIPGSPVLPGSKHDKPPTLLSPYGEALHGFGYYLESIPSVGMNASQQQPSAGLPVEPPLEVWLALLSDTVPFHKGDVLIFCPSHYTKRRCETLQDAARQHFPHAIVRRMRLPKREENANNNNNNNNNSVSAHPDQIDNRSPVDGDKLPSSSNSLDSVTAAKKPARTTPHDLSPLFRRSSDRFTALQHPQQQQHLNQPSQTPQYDVIVYMNNVLADELLHTLPAHISAAYAHLRRPHGVVAVTGTRPTLEATLHGPTAGSASASAAEAIREDVASFQAFLTQEAAQRVEELNALLQSSCPNSAFVGSFDRGTYEELAEYRDALRTALHSRETKDVAHRDVYLPFPSIRRRAFDSEYALTHRGAGQTSLTRGTFADDPSGVAALVWILKQDPLYRLLFHVGTRQAATRSWLLNREQELSRRTKLLQRGEVNDSGALVPPSLRAATTSQHNDVAGVLPSVPNDFVDLPFDDRVKALCVSEKNAESDVPDDVSREDAPQPGVRRRLHDVDPLEALEYTLQCQMSVASVPARTGATGTYAAANQTQLRVTLRHFVVTCSYRGMNADSLELR